MTLAQWKGKEEGEGAAVTEGIEVEHPGQLACRFNYNHSVYSIAKQLEGMWATITTMGYPLKPFLETQIVPKHAEF